MPEFTLYGHPIALAPDKVTLTLAEGGFTDFDFVKVDLQGDQKKPDFLARNPHGKIPVLTTSDGTNIYEARAISRYVATRYNVTHLLPPQGDHIAFAHFEQALSEEISYFSDPASKLVYEAFIKPIIGMEAVEENITESRKKLASYLDICDEKFAKGKKFMAGDYFSMVDVFYVPHLARMFDRGHGDLVESRPNVKAWWERVKARPTTAKWIEESPKLDEVLKQMAAAKDGKE